MLTKRVMCSIVALVMWCLGTCALASDIRVTTYPDFSGSTKQIWIEAENYDAKTAEFIVDPSVEGASGEALYCPSYSATADMQQWWMEYSIDSADTQIDAADLTGTWYCWVRANQPYTNAEEADYLFVKGDPNNGSGETWYSIAFSTADDNADRIANDLSNLIGAGTGVWGWLGEAGNGVAKEFNLDDANKIVFRINEREGGDGNARIDVICWTNDPTYIPTDADFNNTYVTDGLAFDFEASNAGNRVNSYAKPVVAYSSDAIGTLKFANDGVLLGSKPVLMKELASNGISYDWFYRFDSDTTNATSNEGSGGFIGDIDPYQALNFDFNDSFTVETWFRVSQPQPNRNYGVVFGSQNPTATGYRATVRTTDTTAFMELFLRDNYNDPAIDGDDRWSTASIRTTNFDLGNEFHHALFTVKGYDETGTDQLKFNVWIDGVHSVTNGTLTPLAEATMVQSINFAAIGVTCDVAEGSLGRMPFAGDIAVVRVYNRVLNDDEALRNYYAGFSSDVTSQCGGVELDLNDDCLVNFEDLSILATSWLDENLVQ